MTRPRLVRRTLIAHEQRCEHRDHQGAKQCDHCTFSKKGSHHALIELRPEDQRRTLDLASTISIRIARERRALCTQPGAVSGALNAHVRHTS